MKDIFPLGVYIVAPLVLLVILRYQTKFPAPMALLLFFLGPFAGAWALVTIAEMTKPHPKPAIIPVAVVFFYLYFGLPIFGLWVADIGIIIWSRIRRPKLVKQASLATKILLSVGLGLFIGPILVFALWAVFSSFDPNWPKLDTISGVMHDRISLLSLIVQGALAGIVCGPVVAWFLDKPVESRI